MPAIQTEGKLARAVRDLVEIVRSKGVVASLKVSVGGDAKMSTGNQPQPNLVKVEIFRDTGQDLIGQGKSAEEALEVILAEAEVRLRAAQSIQALIRGES